jgi:hypothetical protein
VLLPRVVDENAAHHVGGNGEKVLPALPGPFLLSQEAQAHFVDERSRLQGMTRGFAPHLMPRDATQVDVQPRDHLVKCVVIAVAPPLEQRGDGVALVIAHTTPAIETGAAIGPSAPA